MEPPPANASTVDTVDSAAEERGKQLISLDDDGPVVTKKELISYWLYINGDSGNGPVYYSSTIFQSLASAAGYDSTYGPDTPCDSYNSDTCVVPWGGGTKVVSSVVLLSNGLTFMFLTIIFTTLGSAADYGNVGRWLLLGLTIICWAAQYASVALVAPDSWKWAMALYMISCISYGATLIFYIANFPRLARNTPQTRELREKYEKGEIKFEEYEVEESLERNRISNWVTINNNIGIFACYVLNLAVLLPLADNERVDNYVLVLCNSYWVLTGIWWFVFQQPRPGPPVPKGSNGFTIGLKQVWQAIRQFRQLPNTFIYLVAFFLLADGINTTISLVLIVQNDKYQFSFLQNTYLGMVQGASSVVACVACLYIQRYFKISAKRMLGFTNVASVLIPLWGMIGIWTTKFGLHNSWEFWAVNVAFGLFQAPYYAFSQTVMAELCPPGYDNMFFGLFGFSNVASSAIGPTVIQEIIEATGSNWYGFPFLFGLCLVSTLVIWVFVDVKKGKRDAVKWAEARRAEGRQSDDATSPGAGDDSATVSTEAPEKERPSVLDTKGSSAANTSSTSPSTPNEKSTAPTIPIPTPATTTTTIS
ncbi:hypothetical protein BOTBODRAFT_31584 [Botryobasidium botryosum FD-172 SS1]|uniref:Autophagy-related protein n=1 Tax=Botryobasidium botryosum (strain FD-172 SS1) TaxID=930990 RepID=A0A067MIU4_BOTB1|nr:hypothetical protein BOTBODRAFT_31584 [Botryobasidium botryosum FD-172 SS1]